tara:strand:+ start:1079 stop:2386 length:1308 start_codon:yes stop_codon:yes gene_type:complete
MASFKKYTAKDGKTTYHAHIRKAGVRPLHASFERLSDAKEWAIKEEAKLQRRRHGLRTIERHTVADAIDKYLAEELPQRKSDIGNFRKAMRWWRSEIGHIQLTSLTSGDLAAARDKLLGQTRCKPNGDRDPLARTLSPATVRKYMALLSIVFSAAVRKWDSWLDENPMAKVDKPEVDNSRRRCLSGYLYHLPRHNAPRHWDELTATDRDNLPVDAYELPRLLEACKRQITESRKPNASGAYRQFAYRPEWLYNLVILRLSTGLRPTEAESLCWSRIDLLMTPDQGRATIDYTKNGEPITVPLVGEALRVLREMHKTRRLDCDWVFPRKDGEKPLDFRKRFKRAVKDSGIVDFRPHDLRHTAGSYLAMAGGSLPEIMAALNHKTPQMTKRYMHLSPQHTAGLVRRMNETVFGGQGIVSRFEKRAANDNDAEEYESA